MPKLGLKFWFMIFLKRVKCTLQYSTKKGEFHPSKEETLKGEMYPSNYGG